MNREIGLCEIPEEYEGEASAAYKTIPEARDAAKAIEKESGIHHHVKVDDISGMALVIPESYIPDAETEAFLKEYEKDKLEKAKESSFWGRVKSFIINQKRAEVGDTIGKMEMVQLDIDPLLIQNCICAFFDKTDLDLYQLQKKAEAKYQVPVNVHAFEETYNLSETLYIIERLNPVDFEGTQIDIGDILYNKTNFKFRVDEIKIDKRSYTVDENTKDIYVWRDHLSVEYAYRIKNLKTNEDIWVSANHEGCHFKHRLFSKKDRQNDFEFTLNQNVLLGCTGIAMMIMLFIFPAICAGITTVAIEQTGLWFKFSAALIGISALVSFIYNKIKRVYQMSACGFSIKDIGKYIRTYFSWTFPERIYALCRYFIDEPEEKEADDESGLRNG